jgi:LysR family glycine cleavage system transcriptional activator
MTAQKHKKRLPSLNALHAFEVAARHMSLKAAAEELNVSQSAVSHQIKGLEEALGITLFIRRTRGVELTRKGKIYYPILRSAFESIAEGTQLILEEKSVSTLTLQVYSTFTIRWLLPRLARFQDSQKDIQIRLHTAQTDVNFDQNDVDAAIMIGQPDKKALHYDYLFSCELSPVCSPGFLEKHGPLQSPADLTGHTLLQVYPSANDWRVWLDACGAGQINPDSGLQLESYDVALSTAAQGIGIALGQQPYISRDLQTGTLVEMFPEQRVTNPNHWYLVCRKEKSHQRKLTVFSDWLLDQIQQDDTLLLPADAGIGKVAP